MPSSLRNMPPVAAAATECRLSGEGDTKRDIIPGKDHKCFVRLHGDLILSYRLRAVGGPKRPTLLHQEPTRRFDKLFELFDADAFFQSYLACRDAIHQMLEQTPLVGDFDLAPDNWDDFLPHDLAMLMVRAVRHDTDEHGGVTLRYNVDMDLTILVNIVYSEPKALLLACEQRATVTRCLFAATPTDCPICMEDSDTTVRVRLPCSHSFHCDCILPWFYKVAKCPKCRHDLGKYLVAATDTPMGKFPGLPQQP
ncbi:unnamed protein product [Triticum turgidum subsp. durum]|uniref:RING-type domain-containing protein n=1 Tax=Triticum turgidum subsp. durum TaxID=4567 RepID=A0A9R1AUH3_TRITD|nr:unnamed protein product [Triticum turgidum subsp. durum]